MHKNALTTGFLAAPDFLAWFASYSNTARINIIKARINDPNANDPKWYLNAHLNAVPTLFSSGSKYHNITDTACINSFNAVIKHPIQNNAKSQYHSATSSWDDLLIVTRNVSSDEDTVPID